MTLTSDVAGQCYLGLSLARATADAGQETLGIDVTTVQDALSAARQAQQLGDSQEAQA